MHWKKRHKFRKLLRHRKYWGLGLQSYTEYKDFVRFTCEKHGKKRQHSPFPVDPSVTEAMSKVIIQAERNGMPLRKWNELWEDKIIEAMVDAALERNVLSKNKKHIKK